jgi:hypothetical protein
MRARPELRQGRIVVAWISDRKGWQKLRPAVILTEDDSIQRDPEFVVAAVTTTFADPPPPNVIPLPWHPRGHPVTGLTRRSGVVTDWLVVLRDEDVISLGGDVPARVLRKIIPMDTA